MNGSVVSMAYLSVLGTNTPGEFPTLMVGGFNILNQS